MVSQDTIGCPKALATNHMGFHNFSPFLCVTEPECMVVSNNHSYESETILYVFLFLFSFIIKHLYVPASVYCQFTVYIGSILSHLIMVNAYRECAFLCHTFKMVTY